MAQQALKYERSDPGGEIRLAARNDRHGASGRLGSTAARRQQAIFRLTGIRPFRRAQALFPASWATVRAMLWQGYTVPIL